jgi:hypothetical protein
MNIEDNAMVRRRADRRQIAQEQRQPRVVTGQMKVRFARVERGMIDRRHYGTSYGWPSMGRL